MAVSTEKEIAGRLRVVRPRWGGAILLCGKCLKRHDEGKALRQHLKAVVKEQAAVRPTQRKIRIVKIACVGLCPRRAVVVASAASLSAGEVLLVRDAADITEALPRLLPGRPGLPPQEDYSG